ncbi:Alpha/Beta hydrolase protein [Aspergillus heterothallicus]
MLKSLYLLSILAASTSSIFVPKPPGPYDVYHRTTKLVDTARTDPFAHQLEHRAVLTTIFIPTICLVPVRPTAYIPSAAATFYTQLFNTYGLAIPVNTLTSLKLKACPHLPSTTSTPQPSDFPIVLFSPGLGTTRLFYTILAQTLASRGYIVVSVDHPHDTEFLEFPDGTIVTAANITDDLVPLDVETRARDLRFILDHLRSGALGMRASETPHVAVLGHSLGGAAGAEAMRQDSRFCAGVNLDGSMFGPVIHRGIEANRSFLLFGHENKTHQTDPSWEDFMGNWQGGGLAELELG